MSEILRPGCSRPSQNAKQYGGETAGYLDKATLESRQLAVAKLQLERFAGGEGVGQLKVFQFGWEMNLEPSSHAEQQLVVELKIFSLNS